MDKLKVVELQAQLAIRNMDVRSTKPILVSRLTDVIESEGINVEEFVSSLQKRQHVVADKVASTVPDTAVNDTNEETSKKTMSNSNTSAISAVESIQAEHARECARAAGLKAKAEFSRRKYELLQKELHMKLQLDYECEQLQLQGEIAEANARTQILAEKQRELGLTDPAPVDNAKSLSPQNKENHLACSSSNPCTSGTRLLTPTQTDHVMIPILTATQWRALLTCRTLYLDMEISRINGLQIRRTISMGITPTVMRPALLRL